MKPRVVVLGAGGHAKVVADAILSEARLELVGFIDQDPSTTGKLILGAPVLGGDELLRGPDLIHADLFVVGIGRLDAFELRRTLFEKAAQVGLQPATVIHPSSAVSRFANLGAGVVVFAKAAVNADASVGMNVILNTGAIVEHDCVVGDHSHLAPHSTLAGQVVVGEGAFIGTGAVVLPGCRIGAAAIVAAGAVVTRDVEGGTTVLGVPATAKRRG